MDVKRIWLISDTHFGARANSMEWFNIMKEFHEDVLFKTIKENYKEGDILLHLGDMFDNRQSINLLVNSFVIDFYKRLAKVLPCHLITGNHDLYRKKTNDITSLDSLKHIENVTVYKEPKEVNWNNHKCLIMPWQQDAKSEVTTISKYHNSEYLFCHSEVKGLYLNAKVKTHDGADTSNYSRFLKVYSGHIHYSQENRNIKMIGNPYQMTRSDINNKKGIYILDLETGKDTFFENTISPKFVKIKLVEYLNKTLGDLKESIRNNFVDLYIPARISSSYNLGNVMRNIDKISRYIEPIVYDENSIIDINNGNLDDEEIKKIYKQFDILTLCYKYIENTPYNDELKIKLKQQIKVLHDDCAYHYNMEN